jgi:hypothetical protein
MRVAPNHGKADYVSEHPSLDILVTWLIQAPIKPTVQRQRILRSTVLLMDMVECATGRINNWPSLMHCDLYSTVYDASTKSSVSFSSCVFQKWGLRNPHSLTAGTAVLADA